MVSALRLAEPPPPSITKSVNGLEQSETKNDQQLRLHLGLPPWLVEHLVRSGSFVRKMLELMSSLCMPFERFVAWLLPKIPAEVKRSLINYIFRAAVALFRRLPASVARRGLSDSLSIEAHALSTALWWVRLVPLTLPRFRLGLTVLGWAYPRTPDVQEEQIELPERGVRGIYLHTAPQSVKDPPVLLFYFAGAFFGGSVEDSRGFIERYTERLQCDAFLADYSLCPEHTIEQAYRDCCRAYEWLLSRKAPEKILLMGNSSGGGICVRVLQLAAGPEEDRRRFFSGPGSIPQPAGAALMGPFVNFTVGPGVDEGNSLIRHQALDNIVTERVYEFIQPQLAVACGGEEGKRQMSPLFHDMRGLCPLLISFSSHEVCADDNRALAAKAEEAGCEARVSEQPYLCHGFQALAAFLPEAEQEELRICEWIKQRGPAWSL